MCFCGLICDASKSACQSETVRRGDGSKQDRAGEEKKNHFPLRCLRSQQRWSNSRKPVSSSSDSMTPLLLLPRHAWYVPIAQKHRFKRNKVLDWSEVAGNTYANYVTRRFNRPSARLKKSVGLNFGCSPLYVISRSNWSRESV